VFILAAVAVQAEAARLDPQFVGRWRMSISSQNGTSTWVREIAADGHYNLTTEGPGLSAKESGTLDATNGRWQADGCGASWEFIPGPTRAAAAPGMWASTR
jgi:hypothetical protein